MNVPASWGEGANSVWEKQRSSLQARLQVFSPKKKKHFATGGATCQYDSISRLKYKRGLNKGIVTLKMTAVGEAGYRRSHFQGSCINNVSPVATHDFCWSI